MFVTLLHPLTLRILLRYLPRVKIKLLTDPHFYIMPCLQRPLRARTVYGASSLLTLQCWILSAFYQG